MTWRNGPQGATRLTLSLPLLTSTLLLGVLLALASQCAGNEEENYTNMWVMKLKKRSDDDVAAPTRTKRSDDDVTVFTRSLADHGFRVVRELSNMNGYFLLVRDSHPHRSKRSSDHHTGKLLSHPLVEFAEQQKVVKREKRGYVFKRQPLKPFNDELYDDQWYIEQDVVQNKVGRNVKMDHTQGLGVKPCWESGITGKGITVTILDDGLEYNHTDIAENYNANCSLDLNGDDRKGLHYDKFPFPRYDPTNENKHGTRCAGEVAMIPGNGVCGVGISFRSKVSGVRMLDGPVTDSLEAQALRTCGDIISASWGPSDDGKTLEGPGPLASKALKYMFLKGRDGRGTIFVWASGNGGGEEDNCNCDGYTSSIYTISVSSVTQSQKMPWYAEVCSSTMTSTYSSGGYRDKAVVTIDLHNQCTSRFTGTSAAAPIGAAILALVLEVNPQLTPRDMMWLVMLTGNYKPLEHNKGWKKNGANIYVNPRFGVGLLNAFRMCQIAGDKKFKHVPPKHVCSVDVNELAPEQLPKSFGPGQGVDIIFNVTGCAGQPNEIRYLEHVQVIVNITHWSRGFVSIDLKSPAVTFKTRLMATRSKDDSEDGFPNWPLMSVHQWAENPAGVWTLSVQDNSNSVEDVGGVVHSVTLVMHGVASRPKAMDIAAQLPSNPDGQDSTNTTTSVPTQA